MAKITIGEFLSHIEDSLRDLTQEERKNMLNWTLDGYMPLIWDDQTEDYIQFEISTDE